MLAVMISVAATTVQPFLVGGRWPKRLRLCDVVPAVVRGVMEHAGEYTDQGVAVMAGLVPADVVAATEPDPEIRAAALHDPRLRLLQLAIFLRVPLDDRRLHELGVIGVVFGVWTTMPELTDDAVRAFMRTLVLQPDVIGAPTEPRGGDGLERDVGAGAPAGQDVDPRDVTRARAANGPGRGEADRSEAVRAALARCEAAAYGGDRALLPDSPPGQPV
jgi:hypothetical protein